MDNIITFAGMDLDRSFQSGSVVVPAVAHIEGDVLTWAWAAAENKIPRPVVLDKFRRLHSAAPGEILAFVKKFGVGFFCKEHGLPSQQRPQRHENDAECSIVSFYKRRRELWFRERLGDYRRFSLAADSIVQAAAMVNMRRMPDRSLSKNFIYTSGMGAPEKLNGWCARIAYEVNDWLEISHAHPQLRWEWEKKMWSKTIAPAPASVLGPIALALLTTVPQSEGWLICTLCGGAYQPQRVGRNQYCPECRGSSDMWRVLKRQQRAREK